MSEDMEHGEAEDVVAVFNLIDHERNAEISKELLARILLATTMVDDIQAAEIIGHMEADERPLNADTFVSCIAEVVETARSTSTTTNTTTELPTVGSALLCILEDLRKAHADQEDFVLANRSKSMYESVMSREEVRRLTRIDQRHQSEQQGVEEAQMMQAQEFNSAWSQNMAEFERQARLIEENAQRKHEDEFISYQQKLRGKERAYKFSRDLLLLRTNIDALAKQGRYEEAHKLKQQAGQMEKWERLKLDNEYQTQIATKELQLRQQQQLQLEALRRRIQRGREEHKEHWLTGAQRLMQSHRNMLSDLKSKQSLENLRADVAVKLDMTASLANATIEKMKKNFTGTLPRVDTGIPHRASQTPSKVLR